MSKKASNARVDVNKNETEKPIQSNDPLGMLLSGEDAGDDFPEGFVTMASNVRWFGSYRIDGHETSTGKSYTIDRFGKQKVDMRDVDIILAMRRTVFCKNLNKFVEVVPVGITR